MKLYNTHTMNWIKKVPPVESNSEIFKKLKVQKLEK